MKARFLFLLFLRGGPLSPARSLEEEEGEGHSIVPRVILALGGRSGCPSGRSVQIRAPSRWMIRQARLNDQSCREKEGTEYLFKAFNAALG